MGGAPSTDKAREQANRLSSDEEDDDDKDHLFAPMWWNRSLHKLTNLQFVEEYRTEQQTRLCCRWCHDCHDDALSLHCLCKSHRINQQRLERALLKHPNPTPTEILMDNQLCDHSSTNPTGSARFMGLARQMHFVDRRADGGVILHLDAQRRRQGKETLASAPLITQTKEGQEKSQKAMGERKKQRRVQREKHSQVGSNDTDPKSTPGSTACSEGTLTARSSLFGALSARLPFSPKKSAEGAPPAPNMQELHVAGQTGGRNHEVQDNEEKVSGADSEAGLHAADENDSQGPSGLQWKQIGYARPASGQELTNPKLARALRIKRDFTSQEWDEFGIVALRTDDYIKAGQYFMPVDGDDSESGEEKDDDEARELNLSVDDIERNPYVMPCFRCMDDRSRLPLHVLCLNEQVTPRMLQTIIEPWPASVEKLDVNLCSCLHLLCTNRAVTCSLVQTVLDAMAAHVAAKTATHAKEFRGFSILSCVRVWNDLGELPLHRLCANPDVYPELLSLLLAMDPAAAGCRDDRGLTPLQQLARNPGVTTELLDILFAASTLVWNAPKWEERPKFSRPSWTPDPAKLRIDSFRGQFHALSSFDMKGRSFSHYLCKNESISTTLIGWVLAKEKHSDGTELSRRGPLSPCYIPHEKHGPFGKGYYLLSSFIPNVHQVEQGADPWVQQLVQRGNSSYDLPQTSLLHRDLEGRTPLHAACDAELDPPGKKKTSMFGGMLAKDTTSAIEVLRFLVKSAPDACSAKDLDGRTPLHFLCANPSITAVLLVKTLKISAFQSAARARDTCDRLPLHSLCLNGALAKAKPRDVTKLIRVLLNKNKRAATAADIYGCTPLHYFCMRGFPTRDTVNILLKAGPTAARIADATSRLPADSVWLNENLQESQARVLSAHLERMSRKGATIDDGEVHEEDEENDESELSPLAVGAEDNNGSLSRTGSGFDTGNGGKPVSFQAIREDEGDDSPDDDGEDDVDDSDLESLHRYPHTIQVQIVKAEGLIAKDLGGTSDPFVKLLVDDRHNTQHRTATVSKNLNPVWNQTFEIGCDAMTSVLDIVVSDEDKFGFFVTGSEFLGAVTISLETASDGLSWHDLKSMDKHQARSENVSGRILVDIQGLDENHMVTEAEKARRENQLVGTVRAATFRKTFLRQKKDKEQEALRAAEEEEESVAEAMRQEEAARAEAEVAEEARRRSLRHEMTQRVLAHQSERAVT